MPETFDENYVRQLEETIRKFLEPLKGIPFTVAIKSLTGHSVIAFNPKDLSDVRLLSVLTKAAQQAGDKAHHEGIFTARPNEAGNAMEKFVAEAIRDQGFEAKVPKTSSDKGKAAGYPDREIIIPGCVPTYLDCKIYSSETKDQTFRTFYMSPSYEPKITKDAHHLLLSYELKRANLQGQPVFLPVSWQLYTLDKVKIQVKHEFNASNRDLYRDENRLAEGRIE